MKVKTYDLEGNLIEIESDMIVNSLERTPILDEFPSNLIGIAVAVPAKDGRPRMAFLPLNLFATKNEIDTSLKAVNKSIESKADVNQIPDLSEFALKEEVNQVDQKIPNISGLASKKEIIDVNQKVNEAVVKADEAAEIADNAHFVAKSSAEQSASAAQAANQANQTASSANQAVQTNSQKVSDLDKKTSDTSLVAADAKQVANDAMNAVGTRARKYDLGTIAITEKATVAIGAGISNLIIDCKDTLVGDAFSLVPQGALPTGYMLGVATCATAGKIQVSVFHPALVINAGYTINCKVFAYR